MASRGSWASSALDIRASAKSISLDVIFRSFFEGTSSGQKFPYGRFWMVRFIIVMSYVTSSQLGFIAAFITPSSFPALDFFGFLLNRPSVH